MSDGSKRWKGQLQTFPGGPTGEPIATTLYEVSPLGLIQYFGEAKFGTLENAFKWHLVRFDYDGNSNCQAVRTAINAIQPGATAVTVDTSSNPGFVRVDLTGADLELVSPGDKLFVKTTANKILGLPIKQIISTTEVLILPDGQVSESGTSVATSDVSVVLESEDIKPFDRRRYDKRHLYIYQ